MIASTVAFAQLMSSGRAEIMTAVRTTTSSPVVQANRLRSVRQQDRRDHGRAGVSEARHRLDRRRRRLLGARKDVAFFSAVKHTLKDKKIYLTMDTTKDALKAAPGFKYDRERTSWVPDAPSK